MHKRISCCKSFVAKTTPQENFKIVLTLTVIIKLKATIASKMNFQVVHDIQCRLLFSAGTD